MILSLRFWSKIVFPNWTFFFHSFRDILMHNMAAATAIVRNIHTSFCKKSRFRNLFFLLSVKSFYILLDLFYNFKIPHFYVCFFSYWCFWVICLETRKNSHSKRYISLFAKFTHFLFFFKNFFIFSCLLWFFFSSVQLEFSSWLRWDLLLFCFCKQHEWSQLLSVSTK